MKYEEGTLKRLCKREAGLFLLDRNIRVTLRTVFFFLWFASFGFFSLLRSVAAALPSVSLFADLEPVVLMLYGVCAAFAAGGIYPLFLGAMAFAVKAVEGVPSTEGFVFSFYRSRRMRGIAAFLYLRALLSFLAVTATLYGVARLSSYFIVSVSYDGVRGTAIVVITAFTSLFLVLLWLWHRLDGFLLLFDVLCDDGASLWKRVHRSRIRIKGAKGRLARLFISFLPSFLLALLTAGLSFIFTLPRLFLAAALFEKSLPSLEKAEKK